MRSPTIEQDSDEPPLPFWRKLLYALIGAAASVAIALLITIAIGISFIVH